MKRVRYFISHSYFLLLIILLVGGFLRTYRLDEIPVGFHIDEAQAGYNAFSIWKTGKDETGKFLPTHLNIWNFQRPLGITYLSIPGIMLFGLNSFGVRIMPSIIGILTILVVYLLTFEVFKNKQITLLTSLLFALSPWHINLSRATSDAVLALFFYLLATYFCWKAINCSRKSYIIYAYIFFALCFYSYYATRAVIPLLLFFFAIVAFFKKRHFFPYFLYALIIYLIFPFFAFWGTSTSRFNQVSIFHEEGTKLVLEEQIREDGSNSNRLITRFFHNKPVNFSLRILQNSLSYLSTDFLIFKGGLPYRYIIPSVGVIYFIEVPFLLFGIIKIFSQNVLYKNIIFIPLWIILGLFSASLTIEETPNLQRALFVLPAIQWITAIGIVSLISKTRKMRYFFPVILSIIILGAFWNITFFFHQYIVHSFTHRPWYRFYEMKQLVSYLNRNAIKYKKIYLTNNSTEPYIYFLYYNKTDPNQWQKLISDKGTEYAWNNNNNISIIRLDCPKIPLKERTPDILVIYKIQCFLPRGARIIEKFKYSDGEPTMVAVDFPKKYDFFDPKEKYEPL